MHAHTWNSQMQDLQTIWEFLFGGISLCNQILYEFDQSSVDFEAKPSLVAEVLVMRAWFYLNAMDLFGNVPFTTDFSDTSLPRQVDRKFLFSFIEQQIKDNVGLLQDVPTASNYGRVTKAMAYTTLAKLYINAQEWIGQRGRNHRCLRPGDRLRATGDRTRLLFEFQGGQHLVEGEYIRHPL